MESEKQKQRLQYVIDLIKSKNLSKNDLVEQLAKATFLLTLYRDIDVKMKKYEEMLLELKSVLDAANNKLSDQEKNTHIAGAKIKSAFEENFSNLGYPTLEIADDVYCAIGFIQSVSEGIYKTNFAKKNAQLAMRNPVRAAKENAKAEIKLHWQSIKHKTYGYKAQFAREMVAKYSVITETKTITGWIRQWEKGA